MPPPRMTAAVFRTGSRSLQIGSTQGPPDTFPHLLRFVAVEPDTTYRLRAAVRTRDLEPRGREALGATVEIFEWDRPGAGQPRAHHGQLPRERGTSERWRELDYVFRTSPETHALMLSLVAAHGPATGLAWFDDLSLAQLSDAGGWLRGERYRSLSRSESHQLLRMVSVDNDTRPAIVAPPGTTWEWPVRLEAPTTLRYGVAAESDAPDAPPFCFSVTLDDRVVDERCTSTAAADPPEWSDVRVDLEPTAGGHGTLLFATRGSRANPGPQIGAWSDPRLSRPADAASRRPNIVMVIFDTLRADHVGAEGYTRRPTTPSIDAFAARSVRFARAYAPSAWTATSLASLMTSRYPSQHGGGLRIAREIEISDQVTPQARRELGCSPIAPGEILLPQRLRQAGYETVGFHGNSFFGRELGFGRGFDRYQFSIGEQLVTSRERVDLAREWLRSRKLAGETRPYFLVMHFMDPHLPYRMRREFYDAFGPPLMPLSRAFDPTLPFVAFPRWTEATRGDRAAIDQIIGSYDSEIAVADRAAGQLLDILDDDNTVIVLLSDHGEGFGEHGYFGHGNSMYDELLRVPLYIRLPGDRAAGTVIEEPVSLLDVMPTLLELVGLPLPEAAEGTVLPLPEMDRRPRPRAGILAEGAFLGPDQTALIRDGYKYVLTHAQGWLGFQDGTPEERRMGIRRPAREALYRLDDDPAEALDLGRPDGRTAGTQRLLEAMRRTVMDWTEATSSGLHLRCRGFQSPLKITLSSSETLAEIKPLRLEADDDVHVAPSRRRAEIVFLPSPKGAAGNQEADGLIIRTVDPRARIRLELPSDCETNIPPDLQMEDPALPRGPGEWDARAMSSCHCDLWVVRRPGFSDTPQATGLDESTLERLKALGYVN